MNGRRARLRSLRGLARAVVGGRRPRAATTSAPAARQERDRYAAFRDPDGPTLVPKVQVVVDDALRRDPRLVVLMPTLQLRRMTGGSNTILQLTSRLGEHGLRLRYVSTLAPADPDLGPFREHVERVTGRPQLADEVELIDPHQAEARGTLRIGPRDVLFATWWMTAATASEAAAATGQPELIRLIQDYEPAFYPWSTRHALVLADYDRPARWIVNESLVLEHLRRVSEGHARTLAERALAFEPAVDRSTFGPVTGPAHGPRRFLFYARPEHPRNAFELGLRALRIAADRGCFDSSAWDIRSMGHPVPPLPLGHEHVLEPAEWMAYDTYGRYLAESDILLSLMVSPHTSYPPLEMAASGGIAITNTFGIKTGERLRAISPAIMPTALDLEAIVEAIGDAIASVRASTQADRLARAEAHNLPATWDAALEALIPNLLSTVEQLRPG